MQLNLEVVAERVCQEIEARELAGYVIDGCRAKWEQAKHDQGKLLALHQELRQLPLRADWNYQEPSDLAGIRAARPAPVAIPALYLSEGELLNKIHGAWLGRAAGCILGKPFEMHLQQDDIRAYLEGANAFPLRDFVPAQSRDKLILRRDCAPSMLGQVKYAQEDDDLNYMCLAVKLLETYGPDFTTLDVGMNWLGSIPFLWTWGPEHVVYLNLATAIGQHTPNGVDLEAVASYLNPGVEWIGAQIRTDVYGYVCPGNPELAAELAWRDAYLTHRLSGIYGAMWVAAMNAAAFTLLDVETIIRVGLAQVPQNSRFTEAILQTLAWCHQDNDWYATGCRIAEYYGKYSTPGTINNACYVAAALMYGASDPTLSPAEMLERTITIAVQFGFDTDCNGATAGSIVGMILGAALLPAKWIAPMNDTLHTSVVEFGSVKISDMARRTYELSRIIRWR
jgi:ADP-ribosylglycohydrolase